MESYKGITRDQCPNLFSYIDTYILIARDNYADFLDDDIPLQNIVKRYYLKRKIYITIFNLMPYFIIGTLYAKVN